MHGNKQRNTTPDDSTDTTTSKPPRGRADGTDPLPFAERRIEDVPGHWLLARLGKRVLRPGGLALTDALLNEAGLTGRDVVELAPGLGQTARRIIAAGPHSYVGIDADPDAARITSKIVADHGHCMNATATDTGLPDASADIVVCEAMLTMQSPKQKAAILAEAARLLRPGGRLAIHELAMTPDDLDPAKAAQIRTDLARAIKVNARPMTPGEWCESLTKAGLSMQWCRIAPMALLEPARMVADEGALRTARIAYNTLSTPGARERVLRMRSTFTEHQDNLGGIALIAEAKA